nr:DoxX family protein [Aeoliella straminimaris]
MLTEDQLKSNTTQQKLEATFYPPQKIETIDTVVTWLTLGVGVLLILGLFTRLAAIVGAGFLLSIISTQPPWAEGVLPTIKLLTAYQGIEFVALLVLAAIGAGTWAGLDGLLFRREEEPKPA